VFTKGFTKIAVITPQRYAKAMIGSQRNGMSATGLTLRSLKATVKASARHGGKPAKDLPARVEKNMRTRHAGSKLFIDAVSKSKKIQGKP
jgi:hypothetical protein